MPRASAHPLRLLAVALSLSSGLEAKLWPRWTPSDFQKITFSDGCAQDDWSATPENSMTVIVSAFPGQTCTAELRFHSPIPIQDAYGLSFITKGASTKQTFSIQLLETLDHPSPIAAGDYPVERQWSSDALRFNHLQHGWLPKQLAGLRMITHSIPASRGRTVFPLYLRDVRLISKSIATEPVPPENSSDLDNGPAVEQLPSVTASPDHTFRSSTEKMVLEGAVVIFMIATFGAYWRWRQGRVGPSPSVGPLYELNTRTWKSDVDSEGVIHVGGFESITTADFHELKKSGFHSVWLMGIWAIGAKVRDISRRYGTDFKGSPFAISDYHVSEELGSEEHFQAVVDRAHTAGLQVILDFVPNHMGLDSLWLNDHPEFFIHHVLNAYESKLPASDLEQRYPGYFSYHTPAYPQGGSRVPKTIMVAYGRDPYFYPWIDTAQLDYANPELRQRMISVLCDMARRVDGVRCDMAMLVLREQVKIHRHPEMSWETFNRSMPDEFWPEAIRATKKVNPKFVFMAETYWSMEGYLQDLGFDFTYNKPLYEAIGSAFHSGNAEGLVNFLKLLGESFLKKGVHFLENHDEERAMNSLGEDRQKGAAVLLLTLPGVPLIHQGQMEGLRERLPVQRVVLINGEKDNQPLAAFYKRLLQVTDRPVFREGRLQMLYSNNPAFITYLRSDEDEKILVIINCSDHLQKGNVFLTPTVPLQTGAPYCMQDLFYELKPEDIRQESATQPSYLYAAAPLINQGLYVELHAFDAHVFVLDRQPPRPLSRHAKALTSPRTTERRINRRAKGSISPSPIPSAEPVTVR